MTTFTLTSNGRTHQVEIGSRRPTLVLRVDGRMRILDDGACHGDGQSLLSIDGILYAFTRVGLTNRQVVRPAARTFAVATVEPQAEVNAASGDHLIKARMPRTLVSIHKAKGENVRQGETVVMIESMKSQMVLGAPKDGVIADLLKHVGQCVEFDEVIVRLESLAEEA